MNHYHHYGRDFENVIAFHFYSRLLLTTTLVGKYLYRQAYLYLTSSLSASYCTYTLLGSTALS